MQPTTAQTSPRLRKVNPTNATITPRRVGRVPAYILYGGIPRTPSTTSPPTYTLPNAPGFSDALSDLEASPPRLNDSFEYDDYDSPSRRRPTRTKPTRLPGIFRILQVSTRKVMKDKNLTQWTAFLYCAPLIGFFSLLVTTVLLLRSGPNLGPALTGTLDLRMAMGSIISAVPTGVLVGSGLQLTVFDTKDKGPTVPVPVPIQAAYDSGFELEWGQEPNLSVMNLRMDDPDVEFAATPTTSETHQPEDLSDIAPATLVKVKVVLYLVILGIGILLWLFILRLVIWTIAKLANKFADSELVWESGVLGADEDEADFFVGHGQGMARPGSVLFDGGFEGHHDDEKGEWIEEEDLQSTGGHNVEEKRDLWKEEFEVWEEEKPSAGDELSQENLFRGVFA